MYVVKRGEKLFFLYFWYFKNNKKNKRKQIQNNIKIKYKLDGRKEKVSFDKITARISKLCYGLDMNYVDAAEIVVKVVSGVYPGVTTSELDNLAAEIAAYRTAQHPDYATLAARIAISNLHKQTKKVCDRFFFLFLFFSFFFFFFFFSFFPSLFFLFSLFFSSYSFLLYSFLLYSFLEKEKNSNIKKKKKGKVTSWIVEDEGYRSWKVLEMRGWRSSQT